MGILTLVIHAPGKNVGSGRQAGERGGVKDCFLTP